MHRLHTNACFPHPQRRGSPDTRPYNSVAAVTAGQTFHQGPRRRSISLRTKQGPRLKKKYKGSQRIERLPQKTGRPPSSQGPLLVNAMCEDRQIFPNHTINRRGPNSLTYSCTLYYTSSLWIDKGLLSPSPAFFCVNLWRTLHSTSKGIFACTRPTRQTDSVIPNRSDWPIKYGSGLGGWRFC